MALEELKADHLASRRGGQAAVCSAHPEVLAAAIELAADNGRPLLVEATAGQVNQFGGYTGMTPARFASFLNGVADGMGFPRDRLLMGADHLGPYVWRSETAAAAMAKAAELARQCISAGFVKIHLDTGFGCSDDAAAILPPALAAERAVGLCGACEAQAARLPAGRRRPLYVIGAEVPPPGGALEQPEAVELTRPEEVAEFIGLAERGFRQAGLAQAWERVLAVVVQPGVDFGDAGVARYAPDKARALSQFHAALPGIMTYEVHSTDYQPPEALAQMVAGHFTLLKVGPCLTHAFREAVFALEQIELELLKARRSAAPSELSRVMEGLMRAHPAHWRSHYRGSAEELRRKRRSSRLDRIRYYWSMPEAQAALARLRSNLAPAVPAELAAIHFPEAGRWPQTDGRGCEPTRLVRRRIRAALEPYALACR
ncbi:MAG: class II D-tagatose-bisphosphate aldolase, non-catalytic subunit [Desulfobacterales bacterium]|jgi:D-tagatose-1,6-bisphosphate aldolase subunit GatZ/KbaZ|nr:class II D-tagatose-bisphosphate aldolase, non-catalytic subunit [Desulfobacterales bacterium]